MSRMTPVDNQTIQMRITEGRKNDEELACICIWVARLVSIHVVIA